MNAAPRPLGFALPTAIFLLVILAALGAYIVSLSTALHAGVAWDFEAARAYQAARAGIEWGAYEATRAARCDAKSSFVPGGSLNAFTVTVECSATGADELGVAVSLYELTATACNRPVAGACPGTPGTQYVERQLKATLAN